MVRFLGFWIMKLKFIQRKFKEACIDSLAKSQKALEQVIYLVKIFLGN